MISGIELIRHPYASAERRGRGRCSASTAERGWNRTAEAVRRSEKAMGASGLSTPPPLRQTLATKRDNRRVVGGKVWPPPRMKWSFQ